MCTKLEERSQKVSVYSTVQECWQESVGTSAPRFAPSQERWLAGISCVHFNLLLKEQVERGSAHVAEEVEKQTTPSALMKSKYEGADAVSGALCIPIPTHSLTSTSTADLQDLVLLHQLCHLTTSSLLWDQAETDLTSQESAFCSTDKLNKILSRGGVQLYLCTFTVW